MISDNPRIRSLLRQADRNKESGKLAAAEMMYRQIVDEAPDTTAAWLGLASVTTDVQEKEDAYQRVLDIDAQNSAAQSALVKLRGEPLQTAVEMETVSEPIKPDKGLDGSAELPADFSGNREEEVSGLTGDQELVGGTLQAGLVKQARELEQTPGYSYEDNQNQSLKNRHDPEVELFCYRHPDRSTSLRCYKCSKPICSQCTVKTPVGYLCPDCHREAEDAFFNAKPTDYLLVTLVALPISLLAGWIVMRFGSGFFFIIILLLAGGFVGGVIGRFSKRVIGHRRGRYIPHLVAACVIIGAVIPALGAILVVLLGNPGALFALIGPGVYLATATGSAFYWAR